MQRKVERGQPHGWVNRQEWFVGVKEGRSTYVYVGGWRVGVLESLAPKDAVRQRTRCPMLESIGPCPYPRRIFFFLVHSCQGK